MNLQLLSKNRNQYLLEKELRPFDKLRVRRCTNRIRNKDFNLQALKIQNLNRQLRLKTKKGQFL